MSESKRAEAIDLHQCNPTTIRQLFSYPYAIVYGVQIKFEDYGIITQKDRDDACTEYCWMTRSQETYELNATIVRDIRKYLDGKDSKATKPLLVILEGRDGTGKSTQANIITELLQAKRIYQPSGDNTVGFLREIVKSKDSKYNMFERQLMHSISHVVDAYEMLDGSCNLVMDRSPISALAYSQMMGMHHDDINILRQCNFLPYQKLMKDKYNVIIFNFRIDKPFRNPEKADFYETQMDAIKLTNIYDVLLSGRDRNGFFFTEDESIIRIDVVNGMTTEKDITDLLMYSISNPQGAQDAIL